LIRLHLRTADAEKTYAMKQLRVQPKIMKRPSFPKLAVAANLIVAIALFLPSSGEAKVFRNAYISFELPEKWNCNLEQTEWVCRTSDPGLAEAVIILTAKETGPQDALPGYESFLKKPRMTMTRTGQSLPSTVYKVEQRTINNQPWIDGMHFGSEVGQYYTRYLATTKDKIAVLVTFSAHKLHYSKYSNDFFKAVESLTVVATRSLMNGAGNSGGMPTFGASGSAGDPMPMEGSLGESGESGGGGGMFGGGDSEKFIAFILIIGALGAYFLIKSQQKGKGQGSKKKKR
jgi:hypothetical protein